MHFAGGGFGGVVAVLDGMKERATSVSGSP